MAKDKEGHGSEAHREFHNPQVEHGKYGMGTHHHGTDALSRSLARIAKAHKAEARKKPQTLDEMRAANPYKGPSSRTIKV